MSRYRQACRQHQNIVLFTAFTILPFDRAQAKSYHMVLMAINLLKDQFKIGQSAPQQQESPTCILYVGNVVNPTVPTFFNLDYRFMNDIFNRLEVESKIPQFLG
jgi:hypothetical protein